MMHKLISKIIAGNFFLVLIIIAGSCKSNSGNEKISIRDTIPPLDRSLAAKPPMGWNSWDCLGWDANEQEVKANADFMAKHLKGQQL
jgi:hypothetical protein